MEKQFVISHIHGQLRTLERLLGVWKPEEETLIVLGDNNDYGPNSFLVYKQLLQLKELYPNKVVFLKGTHELLFEKFYANPSVFAQEFFDNGGAATLASFYHKGLSYQELQDPYCLVNEILPNIDFDKLILYLSKCIPVYESKKSVFLSKELTVLNKQLIKDWKIISNKKIFFSIKNDEAFKLHYFSKLAKESIIIDGFLDAYSFVIKKEKETGQLGVVSFSKEQDLLGAEPFRPQISAYKITNGFILEEIKITIEE